MNIEVVKVSDTEDDDLALEQMAAAEKPALQLGEDGELLKSGALPPDFPPNVQPANDGTGAMVLTLVFEKTLSYQRGDGTVTKTEVFKTLTLNRLNGKALKLVAAAAREGNGEKMRATALSVMTGLKLGQCTLLEDVMDASDIMAFMRVYSFFTSPGRRTGS
jgi:hypothetical protein